MSHRTDRTIHGERLRIAAQLIAVRSRNIDQILNQLNDAASPLRARNHATIGRTNNDTDPAAATPEMIAAAHEHRRILAAIAAIEHAEHILARATQPPPGTNHTTLTTNDNTWCPNHLTHGYLEPRGTDGDRRCRWCADVERNYGKLPTLKLIRLHHEGRRIDDTTYRRHLGLGPIKKPA